MSGGGGLFLRWGLIGWTFYNFHFIKSISNKYFKIIGQTQRLQKLGNFRIWCCFVYKKQVLQTNKKLQAFCERIAFLMFCSMLETCEQSDSERKSKEFLLATPEVDEDSLVLSIFMMFFWFWSISNIIIISNQRKTTIFHWFFRLLLTMRPDSPFSFFGFSHFHHHFRII